MTRADRALDSLSRRQFGYFSRAQASTAGLTQRQMRYRVTTGEWESPYRDVFRSGAVPPSELGHIFAATLAFPDAVASHGSAAHVWRWGDFPATPVDLTRPHGAHHQPDGIRLHQTRSLPAHHRTRVGRIPVTTRARTTFDLAASIPIDALGSVIDQQVTARRLRVGQIATVFADLARPGRPGTVALATLLDRRLDQGAPSGSELESRFEALCRQCALPPGIAQYPAPWVGAGDARERVDRAYPSERLIIELDGRRFHAQLLAFETDRRRDQLALAHGWRTLRFTWFQVVQDPAHVASIVRSVLALEGQGDHRCRSGTPK